jgi:hypothetical protein
MISDPLVRPTALLILCVLPAAMRGWSARLLIPLRDDPSFPNVWRRTAAGSDWALVRGRGDLRRWRCPELPGRCLALIGRLVAGYPIRRALYDERWSFATYAATMLRLWLAVAGFWLVLAAAPLIAGSAGSQDWLVTLLLGAVLLLVEPALCRGVSLARCRNRSPTGRCFRLQTMADASRAQRPRFELVDFRGGAIANALALASLGGSSVPTRTRCFGCSTLG